VLAFELRGLRSRTRGDREVPSFGSQAHAAR
jgi:hypothetical protein